MSPTLNASTRRLMLAIACAVIAPGCGMVSQRRVEDARIRIQALQAENEQLRDVVLNVRSKNRDMAARAVEDSRKVRALEEANQRLERSVVAYQDESKQMAALLDQLRSQVTLAASGGCNLSVRDRLLDTFANEPDVRLDPNTLTVSLPADALFDPESGNPTPRATRWIDALGSALRGHARGDNPTALAVSIRGHTPVSTVQLASTTAEDQSAASLWRLNKLRSRLETAAAFGPDQFDVQSIEANGDGVVAASGSSWVTIQIHEGRATEAPPSPPRRPTAP